MPDAPDEVPGEPGNEPASASNEQLFENKAAWGISATVEHRWPASLAVAVAIVLQFAALPDNVLQGLGPRWLIPALEGALGLVLVIANPVHLTRQSIHLRIVSIVLIALITTANFVSLAELIHALVQTHPSTHVANGRNLVFASVPIWLTNVIVFGLWYWELDRGGPAARLHAEHRRPDFLFPQMSTPHVAPGWSPNFFDYLYTSFTNATAFSPTDTMPLTYWAKMLMMLQSMASLLTVALVVSRAVNILN